MTETERTSILTLALMAAFADGANELAERAELARIAKSLPSGSGANTAAIYQDVLMKRASVATAVAGLTSEDTRRLAYELCVGVCTSDGVQNADEKAFLADLARHLGFDASSAASGTALTTQADVLAAAPLTGISSSEPGGSSSEPGGTSTMTAADQDRLILNYAILNGALEVLPDSLSTMAIVPLQMKMVYRIGKSYGVELDKSTIKEFVAAAGIGMTSQFVEQIGVRLAGALGKMLGGRMLGGMLGGLAGQTMSSGFSFATTYALGRLAVKYYATGRTLSTQMLKDTYAGLLNEAKGMQGQHLPEIWKKAETVNVRSLLQELQQP